jgi:hypothetical protein
VKQVHIAAMEDERKMEVGLKRSGLVREFEEGEIIREFAELVAVFLAPDQEVLVFSVEN